MKPITAAVTVAVASGAIPPAVCSTFEDVCESAVCDKRGAGACK